MRDSCNNAQHAHTHTVLHVKVLDAQCIRYCKHAHCEHYNTMHGENEVYCASYYCVFM
jgi:hypothetical protein